jgi:hypothetical protein
MTQLELRRHARELAEAQKVRQAARDELEKARAEVAKLKRQLAAFQPDGGSKRRQTGKSGKPRR